MKRIIFFLFTLTLIFQGCERDITSWDKSRITYYVNFKFPDAVGTDQFGNSVAFIEIGTAYDVTENFTAFEGDLDKAGETEIVGTVNGDVPGYYPVTYSAVNADGYSAGMTKSIIVNDPSIKTDFSGDYTATVYRTPTGDTYTEGYEAKIVKVTDGVFYIDRMLGSYYYDGFGYKEYGAYYVHGFVTLNADNTLSANVDADAGVVHGTYCPAWADQLSFFKDGVYDPETGVVSFISGYAGGREFHVTLTPNVETEE